MKLVMKVACVVNKESQKIGAPVDVSEQDAKYLIGGNMAVDAKDKDAVKEIQDAVKSAEKDK